MPSASWYDCLHVFHSQLFAPRNPQTEDLFRERGTMMLFYMCGIILILSVKEAVDSLRLHGGVSVARNDGGRKLYWSQGKTLRGAADNLHTKYSPKLFYLCISFIFLKMR